MSILTGHQIRSELATGGIEIDPFDEKRVQPNSVDLTLGTEVRVYTDCVYCGSGIGKSINVSHYLEPNAGGLLSVRVENDTVSRQIDETGWLLKPGILYLMHTHERIYSPKFVTQLNGKSSLARLGIIVHFTAAYGDTGFNGQYTLEVSVMHPVIIYAGMAVAQAVFYTCEGEVENYQTKGHYVGKASMGAQPSRSYQQFEGK